MNVRLTLIALLLFSGSIIGQPLHVADSFQNAQKNGNSIWTLENEYPKACAADLFSSVFKNEHDVNSLYIAYNKMMEDLKKYLKANSFAFDAPTKCINRVYFSANGSIDYFYFNFLASDPATKPTIEKQDEFKRLLSSFIADYRMNISAPSKFAHYSPITFAKN